MNRAFLIIVVLIWGFSGFSQESGLFKGNQRDYYFPFKNFFKPVTYTYFNNADSTEKFYWLFQTFVNKKDTLLKIEVKDNSGRIQEETVQRITDQGAYLVSYILYKYRGDSLKSFPCQVVDSLIFSYHQNQESLISWKIRIEDKKAATPVFLSKTREFLGENSNDGTLKYADRYYFSVKDAEKLDHQIRSYFAKGVGMNRYSVIYKDATSKVFVLGKVN